MTASTEVTAERATRATFQHKIFHLFPGHFKLAEPDERPVYVIQLGEQTALLPVESLRREFGIGPEHPDYGLLQQVDKAVEYSDRVDLGDKLPSEVVDGAPSWEADQRFRREAMDGLQVRLALWLRAHRSGEPVDPAAYVEARRQLGTAQMQKLVIESYERIAPLIGLDEGDRHGVVERVEALGDALAHVEALRDTFYRGVTLLTDRIERASMSRSLGRDNAARDAAMGLVRLQTHAANAIRGHFEEIDAKLEDIVALIHSAEQHCRWIGSKRNDLFRLSRRIQPLVRRWEAITPSDDHATRELLLDTYRTLARRFLPQQEWSRVIQNMDKKLRQAGAKEENARSWDISALR